MKNLTLSCAAFAAIALVGFSARAAEPVASLKLASFGLAKMTPISDAEGMTIRGQGVSVSGSSIVIVNGVTYPGHAINFGGGNHFAARITYAVGPGAFAGGFSAAVAH